VGLALNLTVITVGQEPVINSTAGASLPVEFLRTARSEEILSSGHSSTAYSISSVGSATAYSTSSPE
jgi:hypothetical protein